MSLWWVCRLRVITAVFSIAASVRKEAPGECSSSISVPGFLSPQWPPALRAGQRGGAAAPCSTSTAPACPGRCAVTASSTAPAGRTSTSAHREASAPGDAERGEAFPALSPPMLLSCSGSSGPISSTVWGQQRHASSLWDTFMGPPEHFPLTYLHAPDVRGQEKVVLVCKARLWVASAAALKALRWRSWEASCGAWCWVTRLGSHHVGHLLHRAQTMKVSMERVMVRELQGIYWGLWGKISVPVGCSCPSNQPGHSGGTRAHPKCVCLGAEQFWSGGSTNSHWAGMHCTASS